MEPVERFREKVHNLAASRPGDVDVPISDEFGHTRGALLDIATEILGRRGYRLYKVRVEGASWIASYRVAPPPAGTSASGSSA